MATTPEYFGTAGADTVTRAQVAPGTVWAHYFGKEGNDRITWSNGQVLGEAGDDTLIRATGDTSAVYAAYWTSPAGINVDLAAGTVLDGFGTRDTLVNIFSISASPFNDTLNGSAGDDWFNPSNGINTVDGRGGSDTLGLDGNRADWTLTISADGRTLVAQSKLDPNTRTEARNIEILKFHGEDPFLKISDLVDKSLLGAEALVESSTARWNASGAMGSAVAISYSFTDTKPSYGFGTGGSGNGQAWTSAQKAVVRTALAAIAAETQITFTEVPDSDASNGNLRFGVNTQSGTTGYSWSPDSANGNLAGDVWLSTTTAADLSGAGKQTLLREIGHALGLKTPLTEAYTGALTIIPSAENDTRYTVMSATNTTASLTRENVGIYDLSALRAMYGTREVATGATSYAYTDTSGRAQNLVVDDGGTDTLDASATSVSAMIDLREGKMSSIGRDAQDQSAVDNVAIAFGAVIENAVGSRFDDVIVGNASDNLLKGLDGNDIIDGGDGNDTAQYTGHAVDYDIGISSFSGALIVAARDGLAGSDTLSNIEMLQFTDGTFTLRAMGASATAAFEGAATNDIVLGNALDNTLSGLGGNDYLKGGAGTDTAKFSANRSAYNVTVNADGTVKVAARTGADGTDTLDSIERIAFADMTVNLTVGAQARAIPAASLQALEELYVGFFNRIPDADGLAYWIAQIADGATVPQVGDAFYGAAVQYSSLTGYSANMTNSAFIQVVYKNVLGRTSVDQAGLDHWNGQLASGAATRGSLVADILSAAHSFKGDATYGYVADLLDNKLAVATYFALSQGLTFNSSEASITNGMAIAAAVTSTSSAAALQLIGVTDPAIVLA